MINWDEWYFSGGIRGGVFVYISKLVDPLLRPYFLISGGLHRTLNSHASARRDSHWRSWVSRQ